MRQCAPPYSRVQSLPFGRALCGVLALWLVLPASVGCQTYPFETREPLRSQARKVNEVVQTVTPTDILFVIDNSPSMSDEILELQNNISIFVDALSQGATDYQLGFITTDVDCNLPLCTAVAAGVPCRNCDGSNTNLFCCQKRDSGGNLLTPCEDQDITADGVPDVSNCDGGRLRAADGVTRIFSRPDPADRDDFLSEVDDTVTSLGTLGTAYEAGLEAVRRAIACAVDHPTDCPDPAVAALNAGFIRDDAALAIIFLSDEDDCSFADSSTYNVLSDATLVSEQQNKLCSPNECYAYYGVGLDGDTDGLMDWADRTNADSRGRYECGDMVNANAQETRLVNPPLPRDVDEFLDKLIEYKGSVADIRAAAILGSLPVPDLADPNILGFTVNACDGTQSSTPSGACGCWSGGSSNQFCELTGPDVLDQLSMRLPASATPPGGGCQAMPGGRYMEFLQLLEERRAMEADAGQVLLDSICQFSFSDTLEDIARILFPSDCIDLGFDVSDPPEAQIELQFQGTTLERVDDGSAFPGYSWDASAPGQVCLEGGLTKEIGDRIELFVLEENPPAP